MIIDHQRLLLRNGVGVSETDALRWAHPWVTPLLGRPPQDVAEAVRALCSRRISERRKELETLPVEVSLIGKTCRVGLDDRTITRLGVLRVAGVGADWKQDDGTFVPLTSEEITTVMAAVVSRQQALFSREAVLKAELSTTTDVDTFLNRVEAFFP